MNHKKHALKHGKSRSLSLEMMTVEAGATESTHLSIPITGVKERRKGLISLVVIAFFFLCSVIDRE